MFKLGTWLFLASGSLWLILGDLFILDELESPLTSPERWSEAKGLSSKQEIGQKRKSHSQAAAETRKTGSIEGYDSGKDTSKDGLRCGRWQTCRGAEISGRRPRKGRGWITGCENCQWHTSPLALDLNMVYCGCLRCVSELHHLERNSYIRLLWGKNMCCIFLNTYFDWCLPL